jgi:tripartite-type tricarboxylate transporter receptor subunit TctC
MNRMTHRLPAKLLQAVALAGLMCASALADDRSPASGAGKSIRFVVTFPPGGGTDVLARMIAAELAKTTGQTIIVENRPGASGNIGADQVAKSAPDGTTLLVVNSSYAINPGVFTKMPFNPARDLRGVVQFAATPSVIAVPENSPIRTLGDLVALAKTSKSPSGASCGYGTPQHLAIATLEVMSRAQINHISYKGCAPAMTDVVAGQVDFGVNTLANSVPMVTSKKIRALAVTSKSRAAALPEVPTVAELGFPGYDVDQWFGFLAPAKTPDPVVAKLYRDIAQIISRPDVTAKLVAGGYTVSVSDPDTFQATIVNDIDRFGKVAKEIGLSLEN